MPVDPDRLVEAALGLADRARADDWRGPDAYDGLWWRWPHTLIAGRRRRQLLMQLHARSPIDIRRLYRRRHPLIPKALGIFASVGLRAARLGGGIRATELALEALEVLDADRVAGDRAWGYHWDMQTRWSFYEAGSPNVVVSAFAGSGLLEAARDTRHEDHGRRARKAAEWMLEELWVEPEGFFAYHPGHRVNIHNANLLGAWLVHVAVREHPTAASRVRRAVQRTLAGQRPDGSWPYGEADNLSWVDSFHTGYVLACLERLRAVDPNVSTAVARGAAHYAAFFDCDGRAPLWPDRPYPEDAHSAGTGMSTLALLVRRGLADRDALEAVAERVLTHGLRDGHAICRRYRLGATRVHYLRWCDAHIALGLVDAAAALQGVEDLAPTYPRP